MNVLLWFMFLVAMSTGSDVEEVQTEAEEVIRWREGRTFGESIIQRRRTLMDGLHPRGIASMMLTFKLAHLPVMVGGS